MSKEQNFLVTYGLHNFVTYTCENGKPAFRIKSQEGQKMIHHAKALISGCFGDAADVQLA